MLRRVSQPSRVAPVMFTLIIVLAVMTLYFEYAVTRAPQSTYDQVRGRRGGVWDGQRQGVDAGGNSSTHDVFFSLADDGDVLESFDVVEDVSYITLDELSYLTEEERGSEEQLGTQYSLDIPEDLRSYDSREYEVDVALSSAPMAAEEEKGFFWSTWEWLNAPVESFRLVDGDVTTKDNRDEGSCADGKTKARHSPDRVPEVPDWSLRYDGSSCSGFFGNGFLKFDTALVPDASSRSGIRCAHHTGRTGTICELLGVILDIDKLVVKGEVAGKDPALALRTKESDEQPEFKKGFVMYESASNVQIDATAVGASNKFWSSKLLNSLSPIPSVAGYKDAPSVSTALFISREEYANPCFVVMDWFDAYSAVRIMGLEPSEVDVLCLDAHPAALTLDYAWGKMFRSFEYVKVLNTNQLHVERAVLPPPSQHAPFHSAGMSKVLKKCGSNRFVADFKRFVLSAFDLPTDDDNVPKKVITMLYRQDYLPHARASGFVDRVVDNEEEVTAFVAESFPEYEVRSVHFETMMFEEQLQTVRESHAVVSVHGAGNALSLFQPRGSYLVELFPSKFEPRHRYLGYTCWAGVGYRKVALSDREVYPHPEKNSFVKIHLDKQKLVNILREVA